MRDPRRGGPRRIRAGEVILAGGSINTPQLLLLSGVGPAAHLAEHGIRVRADLPGVGDNLQDHLEVYIQYRSLQDVSMQPHARDLWRRPLIGAAKHASTSRPARDNRIAVSPQAIVKPRQPRNVKTTSLDPEGKRALRRSIVGRARHCGEETGRSAR